MELLIFSSLTLEVDYNNKEKKVLFKVRNCELFLKLYKHNLDNLTFK